MEKTRWSRRLADILWKLFLNDNNNSYVGTVSWLDSRREVRGRGDLQKLKIRCIVIFEQPPPSATTIFLLAIAWSKHIAGSISRTFVAFFASSPLIRSYSVYFIVRLVITSRSFVGFIAIKCLFIHLCALRSDISWHCSKHALRNSLSYYIGVCECYFLFYNLQIIFIVYFLLDISPRDVTIISAFCWKVFLIFYFEI